MFQVRHLRTRKVIDRRCFTRLEAQRAATDHHREILNSSSVGMQTLRQLNNKVSFQMCEKEYDISEMIGVWIDTDGGKYMPEATTEDNDILFIDDKGNRHLGMFDESEAMYLDILGTSFTPERIVEYLIIPEPVTEIGKEGDD